MNVVEKVVDQNILVYDADAKCGEFTDKLYELVKVVFIESPTSFSIIPSGKIKSIMSDFPLPPSFLQKNLEIDFICEPDLLHRFNSYGGSLQREDKHIVIFIDDTDSVLVGSY